MLLDEEKIQFLAENQVSICTSLDKTVYPRMEEEYRCSIYKGIQEVLFEKLYENDKQTIEILKSWCQ